MSFPWLPLESSVRRGGGWSSLAQWILLIFLFCFGWLIGWGFFPLSPSNCRDFAVCATFESGWVVWERNTESRGTRLGPCPPANTVISRHTGKPVGTGIALWTGPFASPVPHVPTPAVQSGLMSWLVAGGAVGKAKVSTLCLPPHCQMCPDAKQL